MSVSSPARHVPALDGLRGLAVAAVLAFHGGYLRGGFLGVDLFFVLSGFLITGLLLAEHESTGKLDLARFWERRMRRLLPALFVVLAFVALGSLGVFGFVAKEELGRVRGDALATLFYVANWHLLAVGDDYWALFSAPSPLEHTWSLAIEEQFYVVWPILIAVAMKFGGKSRQLASVMTVMLLGASMATALLLYVPRESTARVYFGTDTRAAAILLGALLAMLTSGRPYAKTKLQRRVLEGAGIVAGVFLAFAWTRFDGESPQLYRGGLLSCGLAASVIVAAAAHETVGPIARVLSLPPLRALGLVSYGLYLWHWPVFLVLSADRVGASGVPLFSLRVLVSLAAAIASYAFVESRIRRGAISTRRLWVAGPPALLAVIGLVLFGTRGASPRANAGALPDVPEPDLGPKTASSKKRVLVEGDSVGASLRSADLEVGTALGIDVRNRSLVGCGLLRGSQRIRLPSGKITVRATCEDFVTRFRADITALAPDLVLVVLDAPTEGELDVDGRWLHPCDADFDALYVKNLSEAIDVLGSRGARVVLATSPYVDTRQDRTTQRARADCHDASLRTATIGRANTAVVDLAGWLCPKHDAPCMLERDGIVLRPDGTHFHEKSAPIVLRWLIESGRD